MRERGFVTTPQPSSRGLPLPVLLALLGQTAISAGTHLAARRATQDVDAISLVTMRILLSAAGYVGVLAALKGPMLPPRKTWGWWLLFGFLAGPVNQGFFVYGLSNSKLGKGEIVTGLLYVDSGAVDLHRHLNTVEKPLNQLGDAYLCPGSKALDALNASLR